MTIKPLQGITVLDMTNVLAGPFCCHQLAHFGADVIKVEVPGRGDLARQLGADSGLNKRLMGVSFMAQNVGKKSVTLNLKDKRGRELFYRLAEKADVVVENFRPGVMDRLGLGFKVLKQHNPDLIYCAISGFGQDGPMRDAPAYDQIVQGLSGVMSMTGDRDSAPLRVGYPVCDTIGGLTAAMAICAAVAGRKEDGAQFIDVSMLEATLATMGWVVSNFLIAGVEPEPMGNENFSAAPSGTFRTGDGLLNIAANKQEQFETLCGLLKRDDLATHADFTDRDDRKKNRYALKAELEKSLAARSAKEWAAEMNARGVPAGAVLTVPEILEDPQVVGRGMIATYKGVPNVMRDVRVVRSVAKFNGEPLRVDGPPPSLGEHNDEVYGKLGLSGEEIAELKADGVI